jgi:hypothetical protein
MSEILDAISEGLRGKVKHAYYRKDNIIAIRTEFVKLHISLQGSSIILSRKRPMGEEYKRDKFPLSGYYINLSNPGNDPQHIINFLCEIGKIGNKFQILLNNCGWNKVKNEKKNSI